jgi:hypothetical protein
MSVASNNYTTPPTSVKTQTNPWKTRPPLAISYDATKEAFPPLPKAKNIAPATASTTSETLDEDTIQSAISAAIKKLEDQYKLEMMHLLS